MDILLKDPMIWGSILLMPLAIIGLAVFWKRYKVKAAEKKAAE
jgi:hypothetical protein